MSRCAFLPTPGDPYVVWMWYKFFRKYWRDSVDKLYIYLNTSVEPEVVSALTRRLAEDPKVSVEYEPKMSDHGPALTKMLKSSTEDLILLMEDDALIFNQGIVSECFDKLETKGFDIVGSGRGSSSTNLIEAAKKKYNLDYSGYGDKGPHFWPNFFFTKRELLMKTDLNFAAKAWVPGEYIKELDLKVEEATVGDTFVWASIQLRNMTDKIHFVPQYHASPNDIDHFRDKTNLWDGNCPWLHIGSVSSGLHGLLRSSNGKPMALRKREDVMASPLPNYIHSDGDKREFERRMQYHWLCWQETKDELSEISEFGQDYREAIQRIIEAYNLDENNITNMNEAYRKLLGL